MNSSLFSSVCAGSPSPVDSGELFDLAQYLILHPYDTFYVRVSGDSMIGVGINDGDVLIIDRTIEAKPSDIVVARTNDGFTVKRFAQEQGRLRLVPANPESNSVEIDEDTRICGVATFAIRRL
jgi:DNA polymerase V